MNPTMLVTKNKKNSNKFYRLQLGSKSNKIIVKTPLDLTDYIKLLLIRSK
jgi:hypothetical protein